MHNRIAKFIGLFLFFYLTAYLARQVSAQEKPEWVGGVKPKNSSYYYGIGGAYKNGSAEDPAQAAKQKALSDLASEIEIGIVSEFFSQIIEDDNTLKQTYRSTVQARVSEKLRGYELVDTWEDHEEYWVFYRLSKRRYQEWKKEQITKAAALALDLYDRGLGKLSQKDFTASLRHFIDAFKTIEEHLQEPLEVNFQEQQVYLPNELQTSIQDVLDLMQIAPETRVRSAQVGKRIVPPVTFKVIHLGEKTAVYNLPLSFSFGSGGGELPGSGITDRRGRVKVRNVRVTDLSAHQTIEAGIDLGRLAGIESTRALYRILSKMSWPHGRQILEVKGRPIYVRTVERNLGSVLSTQSLAPAIAHELAKHGFSPVTSSSEADLLLEITADTKAYNRSVYGIHFAFLTITASMLDRVSGEKKEIPLKRVKGAGPDYRAAGLDAYKEFEKTVPDYIKTLVSK